MSKKQITKKEEEKKELLPEFFIENHKDEKTGISFAGILASVVLNIPEEGCNPVDLRIKYIIGERLMKSEDKVIFSSKEEMEQVFKMFLSFKFKEYNSLIFALLQVIETKTKE